MTAPLDRLEQAKRDNDHELLEELLRNHAAELLAGMRALERIATGERPPDASTWHTGKSWRIELARAAVQPLTRESER